jgi:hypothetical protein
VVEWTNDSGEECRGPQRASPGGGNMGVRERAERGDAVATVDLK